MLGDPDVRQAFLNIAVFLVINVPLTVVLSLVLATALNAVIRCRTFLRVVVLRAVRDGQRRAGRRVAVPVQLGRAGQRGAGSAGAFDPSWLVNSTLAMPVIAVFVTWKQLGFFILLYLAALQNVSKELYEAAAVDGADAVRRPSGT